MKLNLGEEFSVKNNLNEAEFVKKVIYTANAVLAMQLDDQDANQIMIESEKRGDKYQLIFRKIT